MPAPEAPPRPKRRREVSLEERLELADERIVAEELGTRWQARGPPGPDQGGPTTWRGQAWRSGTKRWSNRGGRNREWYAEYYKANKAKGAP